MKKVGIGFTLLLSIITLASCDREEVSFFDCIDDISCETASLNGNEDSDNEAIKFVHATTNETIGFDLVYNDTFIDYDGFENSLMRITIILYQIKGSNNHLKIDSFNDLFDSLNSYFTANGVQSPYFKLELRTKQSSFESYSITLDDNEKDLKMMQHINKQYSTLTVDEKNQFNNDLTYFHLFNSVSYYFIHSEYNILFKYEKNNTKQLELKPVLHDESDTISVVPSDLIYQYYTSFINEDYTIVLKED